jgi:hypothetical protein
MRCRRLAALAAAGLLVTGCSRLSAPRPSFGPPAPTDPPASAVRSARLAPSVETTVGDLGVRLSDLPTGWVAATQRPPTAITSVLPHLATCLGVKLAAVTGDALRQPGPTYRSADSKEWLSASAGPAATLRGASIPPTPSAALRRCAAAAVAGDLSGSGFGSVTTREVSFATGLSAIVPRSLDLEVSTYVRVFNVPGTVFVDLLWIADNRTAAVFDVVNQVFKGDLQAADAGLIAQAVDAVARRISGR